MDRLRVAAFAILILYHVAMVFAPWNFHVKSTHISPYATVPMLAVNAWRLTLLFVVSGFASRALFRRQRSAGAFVRDRSWRLLVPLAFGVIVVVPPQAWVELVTKHGYAGGFLSFWARDYFSMRTVTGVSLPAWNHLWFVGYLWVYTVGLAALAVLVRSAGIGRDFDRVFGGAGVVLIPLAWLVGVHAWWFPMAGETHDLVTDALAHASYLPAFGFGFGLAGSPAAMRAIGRWWPVGMVLAVAGYAYIAAVEVRVLPARGPSFYAIYGTAHAAQQWGAVVALIGIADRWWRDRPIRATLIEGVFPFYIAHQTIIVVVMYALLGAGLPGWAEAAILVAATLAGSAAFYLVGRRIGPLRPLIGLRRHPRPSAGVL
jgi:hypothetical protein